MKEMNYKRRISNSCHEAGCDNNGLTPCYCGQHLPKGKPGSYGVFDLINKLCRTENEWLLNDFEINIAISKVIKGSMTVLRLEKIMNAKISALEVDWPLFAHLRAHHCSRRGCNEFVMSSRSKRPHALYCLRCSNICTKCGLFMKSCRRGYQGLEGGKFVIYCAWCDPYIGEDPISPCNRCGRTRLGEYKGSNPRHHAWSSWESPVSLDYETRECSICMDASHPPIRCRCGPRGSCDFCQPSV